MRIGRLNNTQQAIPLLIAARKLQAAWRGSRVRATLQRQHAAAVVLEAQGGGDADEAGAQRRGDAEADQAAA